MAATWRNGINISGGAHQSMAVARRNNGSGMWRIMASANMAKSNKYNRSEILSIESGISNSNGAYRWLNKQCENNVCSNVWRNMKASLAAVYLSSAGGNNARKHQLGGSSA